MIQLRNLTLARGGEPLIEGAGLQIHPGWKVGLTGANGCGKSSFFALMRGELHAEAGDLEMPAAWAIAHVSQETPALPDAALEFTLDGDDELRGVERRLTLAEAAHDGEQIALLHGRLQEIGGYAAKARAAELLHGLGFTDADFARPVADFSGGWRVRLNLARALMARSDLLLLDEPTNHLDLDAVLWLEGWLKSYPGTLIMISHDRDFLDAVVGNILHIEGRCMSLYTGNYSACERARAARLAGQQAMFAKQQREIAHLHAYIDRFRAQATKARQAQSRLKALARMEEIAPAHVDTPFSFRFAEPAGISDPLLQLDQAAAGYGGTPVLERLALTLRPGGRVGLLGRNGAGKSTLVKLLAGELRPMSGERREGRNLVVGYFAQHQVEQLRPDESPLQHLMRAEPASREQELRDYLGGFDFRGDMVMAPCGRFSGGEKARLVLALLIRTRPNLLLLDEPTNHLDLEMREALTLALQETDAAVVVVSHDRHLLRTTCDELWLVADGQATPFDGDLDDYAAWLARQRSAERAPEPDKAAQKQVRMEEAAARKSAVAERRALTREVEKLDKQLAGWQMEKARLDDQLADPALYEDRGKLTASLKRQAELTALIDPAELRWLEIHEVLEAMSVE
ncbi:MAG: ATP-binding cassette domain-containing protein [Rhodocyclaceae bacterium]|nr:ATP-binding cassette domain-containing protein [Rhodocyclaceae bacterium]MBK6554852.1 ATP-binding cassette domain-containing protein [Rhodocyclaceae bacterium]MBK9309869.1 ATP-binding cassette domain-containing protein [Rhodocyclaceae bacterium]MBK9953645.1 ATP-binding cassette domain-containing protein [Rhodocyclaceae bacterium]